VDKQGLWNESELQRARDRLPHLAAKLARIEAQQGGLSKIVRLQVYWRGVRLLRVILWIILPLVFFLRWTVSQVLWVVRLLALPITWPLAAIWSTLNLVRGRHGGEEGGSQGHRAGNATGGSYKQEAGHCDGSLHSTATGAVSV
jgi:hypothetical protein